MAPTTYADVLARNIRAARSRQKLGQTAVVARMRALGYTSWHRQTMGNVERGERGVRAEEIPGLAYALETSIGALVTPTDDDKLVEFPSGEAIAVASVRRSVEGRNDGSLKWDGDVPLFDPEPLVSQLHAEGIISHSRYSASTGKTTRRDPETGEWLEDRES